MIVLLGFRRIRWWRWQGAAALCAAAMAAACGVTATNGGPGPGTPASPRSRVPKAGSPGPSLVFGYRLNSVAAVSAGSAWAVGGTVDRSRGPVTVIERWNGTSWALVPSPAVGYLASVTATSARNAWAVGVSAFAPSATGVIEHWNGASWTCYTSTGTAGPCPGA